MATCELYRRSTIGTCLTEALDDMVTREVLSPQLAIQVLLQFDKSIAEAFKNNVTTRITFTGHLHTYRYCDYVWTFVLKDVLLEIKDTDEQLQSDLVKIVACDSTLFGQH